MFETHNLNLASTRVQQAIRDTPLNTEQERLENLLCGEADFFEIMDELHCAEASERQAFFDEVAPLVKDYFAMVESRNNDDFFAEVKRVEVVQSRTFLMDDAVLALDVHSKGKWKNRHRNAKVLLGIIAARVSSGVERYTASFVLPFSEVSEEMAHRAYKDAMALLRDLGIIHFIASSKRKEGRGYTTRAIYVVDWGFVYQTLGEDIEPTTASDYVTVNDWDAPILSTDVDKR